MIVLEIEDDAISVTSNNWFGETLLNEAIEYENQSILENQVPKKYNFYTNLLFLELKITYEPAHKLTYSLDFLQLVILLNLMLH